MNRFLIAVIVPTLLLSGCAAATRLDGDDATLRVMSYNIRLNLASDGPNVWARRKEVVASMVGFHGADLVGLQEALPEQLADLDALLPHFARFGSGRSAERAGEASAILYRRDRFELLENDTFWLSPTPAVPGSRGWDAAYERVVTWGRLRDRRTGRIFYHFNTHLDHAGVEARRQSAAMIVQKIEQVPADTPVILTGDFNDVPAGEPYKAITAAGFHDAFTISRTPHLGPASTWNAFKAIEPGRRIDFVFVRGPVEVLRHAIFDDKFDGRFPSDHLPVLAELRLR